MLIVKYELNTTYIFNYGNLRLLRLYIVGCNHRVTTHKTDRHGGKIRKKKKKTKKRIIV